MDMKIVYFHFHPFWNKILSHFFFWLCSSLLRWSHKHAKTRSAVKYTSWALIEQSLIGYIFIWYNFTNTTSGTWSLELARALRL
jgi:hypothetical protein